MAGSSPPSPFFEHVPMTIPSPSSGPRRLLVPVSVSLLAGAIFAIAITRWMGASAVSPQETQRDALATGAEAPAAVRGDQRKPPAGRAIPRNEKSEDVIRHRMGEAERRATAQHEAFQGQFASEPVDKTWAAGKEAEMLEASVSDQIRTANAIPSNLEVQCRRHICKVGSDFASVGLAEDWVILFATAMGGRMPNMSYKYTPNPDGTTHVEAYGLARK